MCNKFWTWTNYRRGNYDNSEWSMVASYDVLVFRSSEDLNWQTITFHFKYRIKPFKIITSISLCSPVDAHLGQ